MARAIDADELHKKFFKEFDHNSRLVGKQGVARAWQGAMQLLYDAPTIDPVKHGKWENTEPLLGLKRWICSCCGKRDLIRTNYCPNCGARMEGE